MRKLFEDNVPFLKVLLKGRPKQRTALLETATDENIRFLSEIVYNLLEGFIPITNFEKTKLRKFEKKFLTLVDKKANKTRLRQLWIKNSKELLTVLLTYIIPILML